MKTKKKILVDIYLAFNLGDDMFLDVLSKQYPNAQITVLYPGNSYTTFLKKYTNVQKLKYPFYYRVLRRLHIYDYLADYDKMAKQYDVLLFLGGGIFRESSTYWKSLFAYRKAIVSSFKKHHKKVFFLGCSFGPFATNKFYKSYQSLFEMCDDVCFRDQYSMNLFKENPKVRFAPDILWDFPINNSLVIKEKNIGYSIIDPSHKIGLENYHDTYVYETRKSIINQLKKGFSVYLLSFCTVEGDLDVINEIMEEIPENFRNKITTVTYNGDIEAMIRLISKLQCLVAARFHAVIIGLLTNTTVIPVCYGVKTINLLKDIKFKGLIIDFDNLDLLENVNCTIEIDHTTLLKLHGFDHFNKLNLVMNSKD